MSFVHEACAAFFHTWSLNFQRVDTCTYCVPVFLRRTGRRAGGRTGNDVTFSNYVTSLSCNRKKICSLLGLLFARSSVRCLLASRFAVCSIFGLLFGSKSSVRCLVGKSFSSTQIGSFEVHVCHCYVVLLYFLCSRTRSPKNSCT